MKKCIVIGGTGFIGSALVSRLKNQNCEVVSVGSKDANLCNHGSLDKFDDDYDLIFHLAAWTQAGDFCVHHPGEQWLINQKINTNVLDWWHRKNRKTKLIAFGTSCVYDPKSQHKESEYLSGYPIEELFTYAMTKRMLYTGLKALNQQFGQEYLLVVPSTVYGPNYFLKGKQLHFIFDLIRKILEFKHDQKPVVLWGDGFQKRELIYIDDFIDDLLFISPLVNNDIVNIGADKDYTIRQFAEVICENIGIDKSLIKYNENAYVGARSKILNCEKLRNILPYWKRTELTYGISQTINWMEKELFE